MFFIFKRNKSYFFRLLKHNIDDLLSEEKIIGYLSDLRTKILWPEGSTSSIPMKNVKHRAYNAFINRIPSRKISIRI